MVEVEEYQHNKSMQLPGFALSAMCGTLQSPVDIPISLQTLSSFSRHSSQDSWKEVP